jgi:hypothetical protein
MGDCRGLYVTNETTDGFEVRELGGGTANIAFDYRIVARRKGYETIRLADKTKRFEQVANEPRPVPGRVVASPKNCVVYLQHPIIALGRQWRAIGPARIGVKHERLARLVRVGMAMRTDAKKYLEVEIVSRAAWICTQPHSEV